MLARALLLRGRGQFCRLFRIFAVLLVGYRNFLHPEKLLLPSFYFLAFTS
jgi:hypothetical protein